MIILDYSPTTFKLQTEVETLAASNSEIYRDDNCLQLGEEVFAECKGIDTC